MTEKQNEYTILFNASAKLKADTELDAVKTLYANLPQTINDIEIDIRYRDRPVYDFRREKQDKVT